MEQFSMAAAAARLDVDVSTLRRWCEKSGIVPEKAAHDKRSHVLTAQQVQTLAQEQERRKAGAEQTAADTPTLQERITALETSTGALSELLQEILQRIEALERQRSQPTQPTQPVQPVETAPRPAAPAAPLDVTRPASAASPASASADLATPGALPPPVRAYVAEWLELHGGPSKNTARRWADLPLEPAEALRYTQNKLAELGYRAHGAALHRCDNAGCVCAQVLPA